MKKIFMLILSLLSTFLFADGLYFGTPVINGPGCQPGSVSFALSPSNNALSILFNDFSLTANPNTGLQRSYCQIVTQISMHNQTFIGVDYRGFHDLPLNANSQTTVSYSLDNAAAISQVDSVNGDEINTYTQSHPINITCNGTRILKIFVDSLLSSTSLDRNATYALDSMDLGQATASNIASQLCSSASYLSLAIPALISTVVALYGL